MIDVMVDDDVDRRGIPAVGDIERAVMAACSAAGLGERQPELCIRFAADEEVRLLNRRWRHKDSVTDVLSFPGQQETGHNPERSLGDIALAMPFAAAEAGRLGVPAEAHIRHLIIHATLHLLGFDHMHEREAAAMQTMERQAMSRLGLHDPYAEAKT